MGFPCDSAGESACSAGDLGSIPGLRRFLEKGYRYEEGDTVRWTGRVEKGYSQDAQPQVGNPYVLGLVAQLCPTLWDAMDWSPPSFTVHGNSPGKKTGLDCQALLQGIFPTLDETYTSFISCIGRQILYH